MYIFFFLVPSNRLFVVLVICCIVDMEKMVIFGMKKVHARS